MSTSVASGSSLKAHNNRRSHVGDRAESRSTSPDIDDQDSVIDLEDELQQELENEMSASYGNLFSDDDDDFDSKSATAELGAVDQSDNESVPGNSGFSDNESDDDDDEVDAALFGDGSALDSNDEEIDLDFVDPPTVKGSKPVLPASDDEDDSASDDEFETVDANALQPPPRSDAPIVHSLSPFETGQKRKRQNRMQIGDRHFVERYRDEEPSVILHMFESHFRFEGQEGVFLYNESTRFFFDALNDGKIPVLLADVLSELNPRYYEGCLIVEVRDYRRPTQETKPTKHNTSELLTWSAFGNKVHGYLPQQQSADEPSPSTRPSHKIPEPGVAAANSLRANKSLHGSGSAPVDSASVTPKIFRKVMKPTAETLYIDLLLASEHTKLTETEMLEIEGQLLLATEEPLTLDPNFQVSRVANATRYIEYGHMLPCKRSKYNSAEIEAEQAEREEKLKLMTLMDDRANRSDFIPNFGRLSRISEWRHKKYVSDAEVYPSALPPAPPPAPGKKAVAKKGRSQVSQFSDGRKVLRTLRFVQNISSRSTHTVFHVLELPDGGGLQGMMRWGTLPDSAINGGSKEFSFPNEEIMLMHIDNFKLLLSIENNRLIYDSAYPSGVPTAGPPPSLVTPTISPRTSTNMAPTTGSGVVGVGSSSVAGPATTTQSPTIASSSVAPSPDIAAKASPLAAKGETTTKPKASVAKKGSRKNSPQPKQKKAASARPSVEPEIDDTLPKGSVASKATTPKAKAAGKGTAAAAAEASKQSAKEGSPSSVSSAESASALSEPVSPVDEGESVLELVTPGTAKPKKSASKASLASSSQVTVVAAETTDPTATTGKASAKKKGARLASKASAAPKEKKSRAKPKAKSTSVAPPSEAEVLAASALPAQGSADGVAKAPSDDDDDDVPLVQNPGATSARMSGDEAPTANIAAPLLMSPPPVAPPFPAIGSTPAGMLPAQAQAAMAQLSAHMAGMPQGGPGRPPFEAPMHITREFLEANPEHFAMLRMRYQLQQQQLQQQQQQGMRNMNNPSAGPMISPQMRPSVAHPGMAAMPQMSQTMQNGPIASGNSAPSGPSPSMSANTALTPGLPGSVVQTNPVLGSPAMRPALGPGAPNVMTAAQQQLLQQQQQQQHIQLIPTREEMTIIQQFLMLTGVQINGVQDPRLNVLVAKARTGELRVVVMERLQALAAQRQQQAAGANPLVRPGGNANPMGVQQPIHGGAPVQNSPALVNSLPPNVAPMTPAMGMSQPPGAGLPHAARPVQLPRDPANPNLQDRAALLEMMQRQREAQLGGSAAGPQMSTQGAPNQQQQQQSSALAALQQQRQQQLNMAAAASRGGAGGNAAMANPAGGVSAMQAPMVRPMQQPGATVAPQSRPAAPMMASPANVPQVITAAQRQILEHNFLANMTSQQQELYLRMQQARQQTAMAPQQATMAPQQTTMAPQQAAMALQQQSQASIAMILQQLSTGQINAASLSPQAISFLLLNAQSQLTPEQRSALQRILGIRMQQAQNNTAQAGAVRPGAAQ
ncbi:Transcription factor spt20 [Coemansia aciculifera]|uniref:Transcription factor spt20 n=1 Tax=Coemansia aciculifera TaxID=417176 RepID=A0A9W8IK24_9FUNG|nr:Transcription factor spt20 [Coemansia aciculifera]